MTDYVGALIWLALAGGALVTSFRTAARVRRSFWLAAGPALLLSMIALILPSLGLFFVGAGAGWVVVALVIVRSRVQMCYQQAVRAMRRGDYEGAIRRMDELIAGEPAWEEHYRFRAELQRLAGRHQRAVDDYEHAIALAPINAAGHLGLAEVLAERGDYARARSAAHRAGELAPDDWRPAYHLGMIEDRCGQAAAAAGHLEHALAARIPAQRERLLARLWLARSYRRLGREADTRAEVAALRREAGGLVDWRAILDSEHGAALRRHLGADVALAARLLEADPPLSALD